tara:strand:- start:56 stop:319 length:264 start_codon:yes stop_codon:yes gene_type:complete
VDYKDELISVPADEARVVIALEHNGESEEKEDEEKEKEEKEDEEDNKEEDEEELNSIREAYGLPKKRKGPHGEKPKLRVRSVHNVNS